MYQIYADGVLIYDSTLEDYKIGKGSISKETNKSGSFTFSIYPEHPYYDKLIKLKTVIKVTKLGKIIFRGRILNDSTDYWNIKTITCEGELGFLQDSIIRPFDYTGSPNELFKKFINDHNSQVDDFKKFKIGTITVVDNNDYIDRENSNFETTLSNMNSRLIDSTLKGYFFITHENNEDIPTIHYLDDFTRTNTQTVEFGSNLKNYTKTAKSDELATAVIPLGDSGSSDSKLTIKSVNDGKDYVYDENAVKMYGWIFKTVEFNDVTLPSNLLTKGYQALAEAITQNITIELNAIDLSLIDKSIESFNLNDYIRVISKPHGFDAVMLCKKQEIDLLNPENDKLTLGYTYSVFTENNYKIEESISYIPSIRTSVTNITKDIIKIDDNVNYKPIDTCEVEYKGCGYVTNESKSVNFTMTLSKRISNNLLVKLKDLSFILRQNGKYTHGSTSTNRITSTSHIVKIVESGILVTANFFDTTNAVNDDVIGIDFNGVLSFEEVISVDG